MSLTLSDFRRLLRKSLGGLDSNDMSDDECDELLNLALWEVEDQFPFEIKETEYATTLVTNQSEYDLTGITELDAIRSVSYLDENGKRHVLDRMERKEYDDLYDDGTVNDRTGFPAKYNREGNVLYIWPPAETSLSGNVLTLAMKEGLASIAASGTGLPKNWDGIILQGAIAWGHNLLQDYDLRDKAENWKISKIRATVTTKSKEQKDSRYAGLQPILDREDMDRTYLDDDMD